MNRPRPRRRTRSATGRSRGASGVTLSRLRRLALALPEVEEGSSYGTPAFRVRGKFFARLREDGESVVIRTDLVERDMLLQADPESFFITDHYRDYPLMLVRLACVRADVLRDLLQQSWHAVAPKRLSDRSRPSAGRKSVRK